MHGLDYIRHDFKNNELLLEYLQEDLVFNNTSFILDSIEKMIHTTTAERIILNISQVNRIDSSAVGMFISLKNDISKLDKTFILTGASDGVQRVLQFLGISDFISAA